MASITARSSLALVSGALAIISTWSGQVPAQILLGPSEARLSGGSEVPVLLGPSPAVLSPGSSQPWTPNQVDQNPNLVQQVPSSTSMTSSPFPVGSYVDVYSRGQWSMARVIATNSGRYWLVTYPGFSSSWDEWVGRNRIRSRHSHSSTPSSDNSPRSSTRYPAAPPCGYGSTCGAVPLSPNPTGTFGTGTW